MKAQLGLAALVCGALLIPLGAGVIAQSVVPPAVSMSGAQFETLMKELSNWGRWGQDDQRGTLNLLTPVTRRAASTLVRDGVAISLARPIEAGVGGAALEMLADASTSNVTAHTDRLTVAPHGAVHSHFDSPAHFFFKDYMYNGVQRAVVGARGATRLSVEHAHEGVYARGVLVDLPRLKGVRQLTPGTPVMVEDLEAWLTKANISLRPGDALLIRTGRAVRPPDRRAGLHVSTVRWLKEHDVSLVGSDDSIDAWPSGVEGVRSPIHVLLLVAMGTPILDHLDLEALSQAASSRSRWDVLLTFAPLRVVGATGSVVNPIALF